MAYAAVYDAPESAVSLTRIAARRVEELCRIDPSLDAVREQLKAADLGLEEVSYALRDYLGRLEGNPGRLEEVETRLAGLDKLKRKYGQSIAEILSFLEEVRRQIAAVEHAGERMEELRREQKRLASEFEKVAADLSARRVRRRAQTRKEGRNGARRSRHGGHRLSGGDQSRAVDLARRPIASTSWSHPTPAKNLGLSKRSPPGAKSRASHWR